MTVRHLVQTIGSKPFYGYQRERKRSRRTLVNILSSVSFFFFAKMWHFFSPKEIYFIEGKTLPRSLCLFSLRFFYLSLLCSTISSSFEKKCFALFLLFCFCSFRKITDWHLFTDASSPQNTKNEIFFSFNFQFSSETSFYLHGFLHFGELRTTISQHFKF